MKRLETRAHFDEKLLPQSTTTSEALAAHVLQLVQLDPTDIVAMMATDSGMRQLSAGMSFRPEPVEMPNIDDVEEAVPGPMSAREFANVLTGGTRSQPAHVIYSHGPALSKSKTPVSDRIYEAIIKNVQPPVEEEPYLQAAMVPAGLGVLLDIIRTQGGESPLDKQIEDYMHLDHLHNLKTHDP